MKKKKYIRIEDLISDERFAEAVELYKSGVGTTLIIRDLGFKCCPQTLQKAFGTFGVAVRTRTDPITSPCIGCGNNFNKFTTNQKLCKTCAPERAWVSRFYNYGVTKPDFDKQLELQNYLCDLCGKPLPADYGAMRFDHCHTQGHMRGILHNKCNIGLHYIEDSEFIGLAVKYSEKWKR